MAQTKVHMARVVSADLADAQGLLAAGEILKLMDIAACLSAESLTQAPSVTLTMDDVVFEAAVPLGAVVCVDAVVNAAFNTSLEIEVVVAAEDLRTGSRTPCCTAEFIFVALDGDGAKLRVPPLPAPETNDELWRLLLAKKRRQLRITSSRHPPMQRLDSEVTDVEACDPVPQARSALVVTQLVLPEHANHMKNTFGGQIMDWVVQSAMISAGRHCRLDDVAVAGIDAITFVAPSTVGDRIRLSSQVNRVFRSSLEVGVRVEAKSLAGDWRIINKGFVTVVASADVPQVLPGSPNDERRFVAALRRRTSRLERHALRTQAATITLPWSPDLAPDLILQNVRGLMLACTAEGWVSPAGGRGGDDGVQLSVRRANGVTSLRLDAAAVGVDAERAVELALSLERRGEWDSLCERAEAVETLPDGSEILHLEFRRDALFAAAPSSAAPDFCLLRSVHREGAVTVIASRSVRHPAVPEVEGRRRGEVLPSGFVVTATEDGCKVRYVVQLGDASLPDHVAAGSSAPPAHVAVLVQSLGRFVGLLRPV